MTQSGAVVGTPSYMAPEQAAGKSREVGPPVDVYALGAILYELLTGRPPFRAATAAETLVQVIVDEPVGVRQLQSRTPRDLETVAHKCLHKDAARRYASAAELADDLQRFQKGEPIQARPVGRVERGWRWCRRNPVVAALLAVVAVLLVGAGTLITWQWQAAVAALKLADEEKRARALAQVNALRDAAPGAVPTLLKELETQRDTVLPRLRELWQEGGEPGRRMRVGLALLPVEPDTVRAELSAWMLRTSDPAEAVVIRDALRPHADALQEALWHRAADEAEESADRFRCLAALAAFAPQDARWTKLADVAVAEMLKANPLHLGVWVQAFQPVGPTLSGPLGKVFRAEKSAERREFAAIVLSDYVAAQPETLAELLLDADPKQYAVLFPVLRNHQEQAVERMRCELKLSPHDWNDPPLDPKWSAVSAELRREIEAGGGLVEERWALCQALPLERVSAVTEALRPAGYRPVRVRPFPGRPGEPSRAEGAARLAAPTSVAVVWIRDGRDWKLATGLTADAVKERAVAWQKLGLRVVDVAGLATSDGNRYALVAVKAQAGELSGVYVEAANDDHKERQDVFKNDGYLPATLASWKDATGALRYAGVWSKSPAAAKQWNATWLNEQEAHEGAVLDGEQVPLDVALSPAAEVPLTQARHPLQAAGVLLMPRQPLEGAVAVLAVPRPLLERGLYGSTWQFDVTREAQGLSGLAAEEHLTRCRELAANGYRPAALALTQLAGKPVAASLWHRPVPTQNVREQLARRQATGAVTLLKLNAPQEVWDVFRFRPDPELRSQLIWRSGQVGVSAEQIVARLEVEADVSARRALILTLGEFTDKELTPARSSIGRRSRA